MPADPTGATADRADPLRRMAALKERGKEPRSASVLSSWIAKAQEAVGLEADRLSWLVASTVVVAVLQRALDEEGRARFLLKGGTYLQYRLNWSGRPTKDIDGLVRGDLDHFLDALDEVLRKPWGPLELRRSAVETIDVPGKLIKPRRFHVQVSLRGDVWRKVKIEISPDEAGAAGEQDVLRAPNLEHFGLESPGELLGIAMRFQIAQKIHACTDPHLPPDQKNERARDAVDLFLLRELVATEGTPSLTELRQACEAVFRARAEEAGRAGTPAREWPPTAVAHPHWATDYAGAAQKAGATLTLDEAIAELNRWIADIDAAADTAPAA